MDRCFCLYFELTAECRDGRARFVTLYLSPEFKQVLALLTETRY